MPHVPTTAGEIDVADLGPVLMHEHVFFRTEALQLGWPGFGGWDAEAEVAAARERLRGLRQAGVGAILDMTVPGLYRDPALVARAAEGTGVKVMFATGYYTYDNLPFPFQYRGRGKILDDEDRLLESLFERDVTTGIGDTGFRAAVLKIVTDEPGMTPDVERLAMAVANVHPRTRTGPARAGPAADPGRPWRRHGPGDDRACQRVHRPGLPGADHRQRLLHRLGPLRAAGHRVTVRPARHPGQALRARLRQPGHAVPRQGLVHRLVHQRRAGLRPARLAVHLYPQRAAARPARARGDRRPDRADAGHQPARVLRPQRRAAGRP